jgi:hypothetical protein
VDDKILTLHPEGKQGVRISRDRYDTIRSAILEVLHNAGEMSFIQLNNAVQEKLAGQFDGSISWYVTTVKLDLEARRLLERMPGTGPQRLRLVRN